MQQARRRFMTSSKSFLEIAHVVRTRWESALSERPLLVQVQLLKQPAVITSAALATFETVPVLYYGRALARTSPASAALSLALSFLGTLAAYLLAIRLISPSRWL